uniref:GPI inositol-deacylase n=1 Tax=Hemiselmis andersenii TaxID=464988 RepID=A0A6T8IE18_HEMAN|mmetsp:Transcript_48795/g.118453  ORF Transcript_48795/g.118453 Transcript_48795/m.118453 type:complete len:678 (+) Transcript_48795:68-2101(+)
MAGRHLTACSDRVKEGEGVGGAAVMAGGAERPGAIVRAAHGETPGVGAASSRVRELAVLVVPLWPFGRIEICLTEDPLKSHRKRVAREAKRARAEEARRALMEERRHRKKNMHRAAWGAVSAVIPNPFRWKMSDWLLRRGPRVRYSEGLIGWLKHKGSSWTTMDVTSEFEHALGVMADGGPSLPDTYDYLFVPGYLWRWIPSGQYFAESLTSVNEHAFFADQIDSEGTVADNAEVVRSLLMRLHERRGKRIVIIGHSKGGLDALAAVAKYRTELSPIVRGIVCLQSPIGGSPVASDLVFGISAIVRFVEFVYRMVGFDIESLKDLTHARRQQFFSKWGRHWPVQAVPVLCFSSKFDKSANVLSACHVSTLLKAPALYIGKLYGHESDGTVTEEDAELPGTMVVRARGDLSHMSTVLPSPKGGIRMKGVEVKVGAWQINKAAISTMLSCTKKNDTIREVSATTDDMHHYEHKTSPNRNLLPRSRSHEEFAVGRSTSYDSGVLGRTQADREQRYHKIKRMSSDVSDEYHLWRTPSQDAASSKPLNPMPTASEEHESTPDEFGPTHQAYGSRPAAAGRGCRGRKKLSRSLTMSVGDVAQEGGGKATGSGMKKGWLSAQAFMMDDEAEVSSVSMGLDRFDENPPAPIKDINPPPEHSQRRWRILTAGYWLRPALGRLAAGF